MSVSIFEGCSDGCGWAAAVVAVLSFGSFGVPIKTSVKGVEVNFFVMQSYKTAVCFTTCWLVLLMGEEAKFSYWGIASGLFWVPGAACGIYGIRNAGLAVAVGTWSSIAVLTSFVFGILIFQERVKSLWRTACAFCLLIGGLVGMSRYAGSRTAAATMVPLTRTVSMGVSQHTCMHTEGVTGQASASAASSSTAVLTSSSSNASSSDGKPQTTVVSSKDSFRKSSMMASPNERAVKRSVSAGNSDGLLDASSAAALMNAGGGASSSTTTNMTPLEIEPHTSAAATTSKLACADNSASSATEDDSNTENDNDDYYYEEEDHPFIDGDTKKLRKRKERLIVWRLCCCGHQCRISLTRRQMGVLGAVINGAWGGCNLIPLHYALRDDGLTGAGYLISYATGALIVNTALWIILYTYHYVQFSYYAKQRPSPTSSRTSGVVVSLSSSTTTPLSLPPWRQAVEALPKFHFAQLGWPGFCAGLLYSIGNFGSILAVTYLGQGTGFSFVQMQLFVSGLWGVFYFGEIRGAEIVTKWFLSAMVAVVGIVWLSYEHEGGSMGH